MLNLKGANNIFIPKCLIVLFILGIKRVFFKNFEKFYAKKISTLLIGMDFFVFFVLFCKHGKCESNNFNASNVEFDFDGRKFSICV